MSKLLIRSATTASLCLFAVAGPALAQSSYNPTATPYYGSTASYPSYSATPAPSAQSIVGRYISQDFYPNPLQLEITAVAPDGTLAGRIWGMRSKPQNAMDPAYEYWTMTFGRNARGVYRNGQIQITFENGAAYSLKQNGNQLDGQFVAEGENRHIDFMKSNLALATDR
jgi:hypothetical protein